MKRRDGVTSLARSRPLGDSKQMQRPQEDLSFLADHQERETLSSHLYPSVLSAVVVVIKSKGSQNNKQAPCSSKHMINLAVAAN